MKTKPEVKQAAEIAWYIQEKGAELEQYKDLKILRYKLGENPAMKVYKGRGATPVANYYYYNEEQRAKAISNYKAVADLREKWKVERKAARASVTNESIKIGTIFHSAWGYDQTNNDFYEVVGKIGRASVVLRELAQEHCGPDGPMSCYVKPVPGSYTGEPFVKRLGSDNSIKMESYAWASIWDREKTYKSWYA